MNRLYEKLEKSKKMFILLFVVFSLLFVISMFGLISQMFMRPLTKSEINECTLIASDIYFNQKDALIYEVPDNYEVTIDATSITVSPTDMRYGDVVCKLKNGEIVGTLDKSVITEYHIACFSIAIVLYFCLLLMVLGIFYVIAKIELALKRRKNQVLA